MSRTLSLCFLLLLYSFTILLPIPATAQIPNQPNVLFIAVDDLNDWVGALGGHPAVKTPNLDALAAQGMLFTEAYCSAPSNNASRTAVMTGIQPANSGIYHDFQRWRESDVLRFAPTITQYFRRQGYSVIGSGKLFHDAFPDAESWDLYWPSPQLAQPESDEPVLNPVHKVLGKEDMDWRQLPEDKAEMNDWQVADWIVDRLDQYQEEPFFLACGFSGLALPWHAPQSYFDLYPLSKIELPLTKNDDLNDIPEGGRDRSRVEVHNYLTNNRKWRTAVQAYLANITFVDDCIGRVLDGLESSPYRNNTIVVLWSDQGMSLGEKQHWQGETLWEEATKTVLMMRAPGLTKPGSICETPVNLIDIYPTLLEVCGLPNQALLNGHSLLPLLEKPKAKWKYPSITTNGKNNHAIRLGPWRYIRYADGSEELYDRRSDPMEWTNLALNPQYQSTCKRLRKYIPLHNAGSEMAN